FSVTQNKSGKETNYFLWSFGDGTSALGAKVYHAYQFPGSYNVVLNGSIDGGEEAVARTKVLVTESNLKITAIDFMAGYIEIFNNSDKEQNLNNWSLRTGEKNHVFPLDTIISPKSAVKISLNNIGFVDQNIKEVTLVYPDGGVASIASLQSGQKVAKASGLKKSLVKAEQLVVGKVPETKSQVPRDFVSGTATTSSKNVVVLTKESSWFERIKNVLFK
ncbi:MAG: PKD domain-containing protein, partial [Candidatus Vogelbacteria bacterium]|nr:PKD domain-containing protein [Candidatus Vogelbacteria bacterium]